RLTARRAVVDRLRDVAASVLAAVERVPTDRARDRVESGEWPDESTAADFLGGSEAGGSAGDRARGLVGGETAVERRAGRTVAALAAAMPGVSVPGTGADRSLSVPERRVRAGEPVERRTRRWTGVAGLAILAVGVGTLDGLGGGRGSLVVAAAAVAGAVGYATLGRAPTVSLAVERRVEPERPDPGDRVDVTVTVTNEAGRWVPDLRLVDGVPPGLRVVDGSPRFATALRSGESVRFSYAVEATRGSHAFDPLYAVGRDLSGAVERERRVEAAASPVVECVPDLDADAEVPVYPRAARRVGRVRTDVGGDGVEFHSVRAYRQGDPLNRVDWNHVAATGEFATLQFHEERAATVAVLVDARAAAYVTDRPEGPAVPDLQLAAADRLVSSLLSSGDSVGLAALSPDWCWLEPRGGGTQRARARRLLSTHPAFDAERPTDPFYGTPTQRRLRRELPDHAQLVVLSPLCDDRAVAFLLEFRARGYPVTVVSPDPTGGRTTGRRLAAVERAVRLSRLRRAGVRVVDWDGDRPLRAAVDAAAGRWSA
ncbi:MAG: DUF58 domain-containing protein, partial [Haloarculaceae archaeon]